jgi:single-strand DNA-binding protein
MNNVILMGRLTADPELRQTQSGTSSCRFTIAVNRKFKNKETNEYDADFITCVAWRQTAEFVSRYFSKGSMICVSGSLRSGSYTDKNHSDVTHYTTDVYVDSVEFTGEKKQQGNTTNYAAAGTPQQAAQQPPQYSHHNALEAAQPDSMSYTDLSSFEEILSDGDVPF